MSDSRKAYEDQRFFMDEERNSAKEKTPLDIIEEIMTDNTLSLSVRIKINKLKIVLNKTWN